MRDDNQPRLLGWQGTYLLLLRLDKPRVLMVGRLGDLSFPAGYYIYVGSALGPGGTGARLSRHLKRDKKLHWHIDYLREEAEVEEIWAWPTRGRRECQWVELVTSRLGGLEVAKGFGASDCRCPTHLLYYPEKPDIPSIWAALGPLSGDASHDDR